LDLFEQERAAQKKSQDEFYKVKAKEDNEADSRKPAFFQKKPDNPDKDEGWREKEFEAYKKL